MTDYLRRRFRERPGQTLVEFALILPLLIVVILGVVEFGRLFFGFSTLQNAARYAADVASKSPPHLGDPVPGDPLGRVYAEDLPNCGQPNEQPCYLANIREAARRYAPLFSPADPNIHVYFLPVKGVVSNQVGGLVEVQIEYSISPITPVLKDLAPLGVPVHVDSRRTIVNLDFPAEELLTPLPGTPTATPAPTVPVPGCGGKYTTQGEDTNQKVYSFQVTNVSGGNGGSGDGRGIVGLIVGWCPAEFGQLLSVTIGGVPLPGLPSGTGAISLPGSGVKIREGETMVVEMTFEHNLNPSQPERWPSWHLTFDDYCMLWSTGGRNCPYPTGTPLPTLTPTQTPSPSGSPTPWPTGTLPPICGMYISAGPVFADTAVTIQTQNGGNSSPALTSIVVMWGSGWRPLKEVRWGGQTVWTGTRYYSALLGDLVGDFPAGSARELQFVFDSGPITWLSFQVSFDNGCYIAYSDPYQPTPPPIPTYTPTPVPGWIYLEVTHMDPAPPACATSSFVAQAMAYYPPAGYFDGAGIQRVVFQIYDPNNNKVFEKQEGTVPYCLNGDSGGVCASLGLGDTWPGGSPIVSGTHTLQVTAYTTSFYGSYQRTISTEFHVCREPLHIEVSLSPSGSATDQITAQAIAWDPAVCASQPDGCQDGEGISKIYFDVSVGNTLYFRRMDSGSPYCANSSCGAVDFSSGRWPLYGGGENYGNTDVVSGTHTLTVRVQAASGRIAEVSQSFRVSWDPCTPYILVSKAKSANRKVTLTLRNKSPYDRWIYHLYVNDWPPAWGSLNKVTVIGTLYQDSGYGLPDPSAPYDLATSGYLDPSYNRTVILEFTNSVPSDVSPLSGAVVLDNGCQIDY
jgi:hypothetical protein